MTHQGTDCKTHAWVEITCDAVEVPHAQCRKCAICDEEIHQLARQCMAYREHGLVCVKPAGHEGMHGDTLE